MAEDTDVLEQPAESGATEFSSVNRRAPASSTDIMSGMADIKSGELAEKTRVFDQTEARMEEDRGRMTAAMAASGLEAEKLKPWNYEEESRKRTADPLETFGSLGSVFGILASTFTRAPMENALNASAAAMNAVKAANEEDYKKAYTAWKDNMALVEKRHKMIQDQFNDSQALFRTDMAAGTVKAQNIATRFGDEQSLFLLNNGMNKEFFDLQSQRATAMEKMSEASRKITENTFREQTFKNIVAEMPEAQRNDPVSQMRAWNYAHGMNSKIEEDVMMQWWSEHPGARVEDAAKFAVKFKADQHVSANIDQAFMRKFYEENPHADTIEFSKAYQEFKKGQKAPGVVGGNKDLTPDRIRAQAIAEYRDKLKASVDPETGESYSPEKIGEMVAKYDKKLKTESAAPSGNQVDKIQGMIDQTKYFEGHMDTVEQLLAKHKAIAGLGGKVTRPAEIIANIFGSNETDRKQFEREILGMQETASRILTGSTGRPLAAEAAKINGIVAGLQLGDTTANTVRAYRELRPLIQKIRNDLATRKGEPPAAGSAPPATKTEDQWWKNDKPAGRRSDVMTEDMAVG